MNRIESPLAQGMNGEVVSDLQNALRLCIDRGVILAANEPTRRELSEALRRERTEQRYGSATAKLVSIFQDERRLQASGEVDEPTAKAFNDMLEQFGALNGSSERRLDGRVTLPHGAPVGDLKLRLYRLDFGGAATLIGETTTLAGGEYTFALNGAAPASLQVRSVDATGAELPLSRPLNDLNGASRSEVNLIAPAKLQPLTDEYRRLSTDLTPQIGQMARLAEAKENAERQDLTVLNRATGWDARLIALAATAERLSADPDVQLPAASIYGLLRAGLPTDKRALSQLAPDVVEQALKTVRDARIIDVSDQQIAEFKTQFSAFTTRARLKVPAPGSRATYGQLLAESGLNAELQDRFAGVFASHRGTGAQLWEAARQAGLDAAQIGKLQMQGKLAFLAGNSQGMTARLMAKQLNDPAELIDHDFHRPDTWAREVLAHAGVAVERRHSLTDADKLKLDAEIPERYAAPTTEARLDAYAADMARKVTRSYPTQVIGRLIAQDEIRLSASRDDTATLLKQAAGQGFRLGETPVNQFFATHAGARAGMSDADFQSAKHQLKAVQRVYQITPANESMPVMFALDMTSAYDVMAYPEQDFIDLYEAKYFELHGKRPAPSEAQLVYRKAKQVHSVTFNMFAIAGKIDSQPALAGLSAPAAVREDVRNGLIRQYPTLESLFGSMDFCECEHCRSVLSPAAYLVDLMRFVDPETREWENFRGRWKATDNGQDYPHPRPFDVLLERRPDLPHIALTCQNTHTALPYIDIVNEILEYYVAHGALDAAAARDTGDATTAELLAEPQNVVREAYDELRQSRYPLTLPFDLWSDTARQFAADLALPLPRVMESIRPTDALFDPAAAFDRFAVFMEQLGLTAADVAVFTDPDPLAKWHELYGFSSAQEATTEAIDASTGERLDLHSARTLARRLGVTYDELTQIVRTGFVNPRIATLNVLNRIGVDIGDARAYLDHRALLGQDPANLSADERRSRLEAEAFKQRLADSAVPESAIEAIPFDAVLVLADNSSGGNFDITTLRFANGAPADAPAFLRINLFTRLWRKLGWTVEETGRALDVMVPAAAPFEAAHFSKQPLKTALVYLAHLKTLDQALRVGKDSRLKLLAFWSDVPSAGEAVLAQTLNMTVHDLTVMKELSGLDPFARLDSQPLSELAADHPFTQTLQFVEVAREIKGAALKVAELDYLIRHHRDDPGAGTRDGDGVIPLLKKLADGIHAIRVEHAMPEDAAALSDDVLRQKLGLVLAPDVAARFIAMMNGTAEFTATRAPSNVPLDPAAFAAEPAIRELRYNATRQEQKLTFRGVLSDAIRTTLTSTLPAPASGTPHVPSPIFAALLEDVQRLARDFFDLHLRKQSGVQPATGFIDESDYELLFDTRLAVSETEEQRLRRRRLKVAQAFFPFLQQRLIRDFVVETLSAHTGADPSLVSSLLTDQRLTGGSEPLIAALTGIKAGESGAGFFDEAGTVIVPVDGARFEGYLEVPASGAYRFNVVLDKKDAGAELQFPGLSDAPLLSGTAPADNSTLGDAAGEFVELQAGVPYRFRFELPQLSGGGARLLVQGETLARTGIARLRLYRLADVERAESGVVLLTKLVRLASAFGFNEREVRYLLTHGSAFDAGVTPAVLPFDGTTLAQLPTRAGVTAPGQASRLFGQFLRWAAYARLKRDIAGGADALIGIFEANAGGAANRLDLYIYPAIARLVNADAAVVKATAETLGITAAPGIDSERPLQRLIEAVHSVQRFGVPASTLREWMRIARSTADGEPRFEMARDLKESLKARLEPQAWRQAAQPIFDRLRRRQRDALAAYVTRKLQLQRTEQLYEYFLIDPGMEPVVQTSRIRLAISSLQLFIQRSLLNMEPKVHPSVINSKHWDWMKRYRVWEAGRKIFLFPENWLEPEFRDDKTHLFTELEGALLQGDVSSDLADDAFLAYLKTLDEMARLEIVGLHLEESQPGARTVHVIGRTFSKPHKHFYRRYARQAWTPWAPLNADVQGDHLAPVVWRDRLYLFWVTFMDKPIQDPQYGSAGTTPLAQASLSNVINHVSVAGKKKHLEVQLHWSECVAGEWSAPQSSGFMPVTTTLPWHIVQIHEAVVGPLADTFELDSTSEPTPYSPPLLRVPLNFDPGSVFVHVSKEPYENGEERGIYVHLRGGGVDQACYLAGRNASPESAAAAPAPANPLTSARRVMANRYAGSGALAVEFRRSIVTETGQPAAEAVQVSSVLQRCGGYSIVPCDSASMPLSIGDAVSPASDPEAVAAIARGLPEIAALMRPVFFQDKSHTMFVEPTVAERTIEEWQDWVTPSPQPESGWRDPQWWKDLTVLPEVPTLVNPGEPRINVGPESIVHPDSRVDWLANPGTALEFDGVLIGSSGQPGGAHRPGSINVVGGSGFNATLARHLEQSTRAGFGGGATGSARPER